MKPRLPFKLFLLSSLLLCGLGPLLFADDLKNSEVQFTGTISDIVMNGEDAGTVFIRISDFDLRVIVNAKTDVQDKKGDDLALSALSKGDIVEINGKYSSAGVVASEIRLVDALATEFDLRGHITAIQSSGADLQITLLGITVTVTPSTKVTSNGATVPASALKTGTSVQIEGSTAGSIWTANTVRILSGAQRKERLHFEGTVTAITETGTDEKLIKVKVDGPTDNVTDVNITPNTRVKGDLVVGATVLVKGTLDPALSVTATVVRVLEALEIKPDERKLKIDETATFTAKLRETATVDTVVKLSSSDTKVLVLSAATVTVLKGNKNGDFSAKALATGIAVITAEALGQKATAEVKVGEVSEDENEHPAGAVRIGFAPDRIKMGLKETRDVLLLVKPPQKAAVKFEFTIANKLVTITDQRELGDGAAMVKLTIQSGSKEGSESIVATAPKELGSAKAELLIEISARKPQGDGTHKVQIDFHPDEVKLAAGESATVELQSDASFDEDVVVALTAEDNKVVEAPSTVTISKGTKSANVTVKGKAAGKTHVIAALPEALGGDTAKLRVEVQ